MLSKYKTPYFPSDNQIISPVTTIKIKNLSPEQFRSSTKELIELEKKQDITEIIELATELKECEEKLREFQRTIWKKRRNIIIDIEKLGGIAVLGCATFTEFCKKYFGNPNKSRIATYIVERQCGRYELLLELPLCSNGASFYKPLNAIKAFRKPEGEERKSHACSKLSFDVPPRKLELLREAWSRAVEISQTRRRRTGVKSNDLFEAVQDLHFKYPEEVCLPRVHNCAAKDKLNMKLLKDENEKLRLRISELEKKIGEHEIQ